MKYLLIVLMLVMGCDFESDPKVNEVWMQDTCVKNPFEESACGVLAKILDVKDGYVKYKYCNSDKRYDWLPEYYEGSKSLKTFKYLCSKVNEPITGICPVPKPQGE